MSQNALFELRIKLIVMTAMVSCTLNLAFIRPPVRSQDLNQRISLDVDRKTLKQTLDQIAAQAHISIIYSDLSGVIRKEVTIHVKDKAVSKVLDDLLRPLNLTYENIDNRIVIKFVSAGFKAPTLERSSDQSHPLKGRVINSNNSPLSAVTIQVKGGAVLTTTDSNGEFEVEDISDSTILQFSIVGYHTKDVVVIGNEYLTVTLQNNAFLLNEVNVVSTGYQTLPKERATGSFDQIDRKLVSRSTSSNILDRLNGVASGIRFNGAALNNISTSPANRLLGINIRGESTLSNNVGRDPLIVLDNFPYEGNISNINPNDIESITVLKDAAAASIWGARSGNGVIVITTKKGRSNQPLSVEWNAVVTLQNKPNLFYDQNYLSASDYINVETDLFKKGYFDSYLNDTQNLPPLSPVVDILDQQKKGLLSAAQADTRINDFRSYDVRNDLQKYVYRKAVKQQYSLGLRGGNTVNRYSFFVGYDNNQDNLQRNGFNRFTLNATNVYNPVQNLELTAAINYSENTTALNNSLGLGSIAVGGPVSNIYPYARLADPSGRSLAVTKDYRASYINDAASNGFLNWNYVPLDELQLADNTTKVNSLLLRASAKYKFTPDLNVDIQYGRERQMALLRNYQSADSYAARKFYNQFTLIDPVTKVVTHQAPAGGFLDLSDNELVSQNGRILLNFDRNFGDRHQVTALAGAEIRQVVASGYNRNSIGYDDEFGTAAGALNYVDFYQISPYGYAQLPRPDNAVRTSTNRFISYFANVAYTFNQKYTATLSGRKDGANLFGVRTNDKITPLWSAGIAYDIDREDFYSVEWLPRLKLRATYGYNGNVYNGSAYVTGTYSTNSLTGAQQITNLTAPNPELRWEKVRNINLGLDFATAKSRLAGTIEYYRKDGQDLIQNIPLFPSSGFSSFIGNAASTVTTGFDVTLAYKVLSNRLKWTATILASTLHDEVKNYNITYNNATIRQNPGGGIPSVGRSLYGIYSYKWAGLDPINGDPMGYLNGKVSKDYAAIINNFRPDSLVYNGPARPKVYGSLRNDFSYHNFTLSANVGYQFGYVFRRNSVSTNLQDLISAPYGQHADYAARWTKTGDELHTNVPSLAYPANNNRNLFYQYSEALVADASNIRLLDLRLGYEFQRTEWAKLPFKSLQLFAYATNLGVIWRANKYGLDPDLPTFQSHLLPNPFSISFGLNAHL